VPIVTLDTDGEKLPSDWYLQLAREAQRRLRDHHEKGTCAAPCPPSKQ